MAKIIPVTQSEQQIVSQHGDDDWYVLVQFDTVQCLNDDPGVLIQKNGHTRWVRSNQVQLNGEDHNHVYQRKRAF